MEFFAHKSELLDELDLLQGAVEKKSTVPILSHFLLDAADFKLQIAATDLELAARSSCTAKVSGWEAGIRTPIRRSRVWRQITILLVCLVLSRTLPPGFAPFSALNVAKPLPSF